MLIQSISSLAEEFGLPPAVVKGFHPHRGKPSPPDLEKIRAELTILAQKKARPAGAGAFTLWTQPDRVSAPVAMIITRLMPNPTWVRLRKPDGHAIEVQVRNNKKLIVGRPLRVACTQSGWICVERGQSTQS